MIHRRSEGQAVKTGLNYAINEKNTVLQIILAAPIFLFYFSRYPDFDAQCFYSGWRVLMLHIRFRLRTPEFSLKRVLWGVSSWWKPIGKQKLADITWKQILYFRSKNEGRGGVN